MFHLYYTAKVSNINLTILGLHSLVNLDFFSLVFPLGVTFYQLQIKVHSVVDNLRFISAAE